jgi:hypothetical protein
MLVLYRSDTDTSFTNILSSWSGLKVCQILSSISKFTTKTNMSCHMPHFHLYDKRAAASFALSIPTTQSRWGQQWYMSTLKTCCVFVCRYTMQTHRVLKLCTLLFIDNWLLQIYSDLSNRTERNGSGIISIAKIRCQETSTEDTAKEQPLWRAVTE